MNPLQSAVVSSLGFPRVSRSASTRFFHSSSVTRVNLEAVCGVARLAPEARRACWSPPRRRLFPRLGFPFVFTSPRCATFSASVATFCSLCAEAASSDSQSYAFRPCSANHSDALSHTAFIVSGHRRIYPAPSCLCILAFAQFLLRARTPVFLRLLVFFFLRFRPAPTPLFCCGAAEKKLRGSMRTEFESAGPVVDSAK